jgi:hypothetical protein
MPASTEPERYFDTSVELTCMGFTGEVKRGPPDVASCAYAWKG